MENNSAQMIFKREIVFVVLMISTISFLSCSNNNTQKNRADKKIVRQSGYPIIQFDTTYHDFGTLVQGEKVEYTFKFKNTGTADLIIHDAYSTCGCTVPKFSDKPIHPGEEGKIDVIFNSEGKRGLQYKTVTIKLNTKIPEKSVEIKANVILENNYKS